MRGFIKISPATFTAPKQCSGAVYKQCIKTVFLKACFRITTSQRLYSVVLPKIDFWKYFLKPCSHVVNHSHFQVLCPCLSIRKVTSNNAEPHNFTRAVISSTGLPKCFANCADRRLISLKHARSAMTHALNVISQVRN